MEVEDGVSRVDLEGALENHYKMINEFKGVPGALPDKLEEGRLGFPLPVIILEAWG